MTLDAAITAAAEQGARKALAAHVPCLALSVPEVAKSTGAGVTTVRAWIAAGLLPRVPHTTRVLVPTAAVAGADFQNVLLPLELQRLGHHGHYEGLGDRLAVADREGAVLIRGAPVAAGNEYFPGHP